jgi:hypothetical protein
MDLKPIEVKKPRAVRRSKTGLRYLTQTSRQIRKEFLPLYLKNRFLHAYTTPASLQKFLRSFVTPLPQDIEVELVIRIKFCYPNLDLLPIFRSIAAENREGLRISFECKDWDPTKTEILNLAVRQRSFWQGLISNVKRITCYGNDTKPAVYLDQSTHWFPQDRANSDNAKGVWELLGFIVR